MINRAELFKSKASQLKNTRHFVISTLLILGYLFNQNLILSVLYSVLSDLSHFFEFPIIDVQKWVIYILLIYPSYTVWKVLTVYNEEYIFNEDRLIVNTGVLNKKSDFLEYYRIKDYTLTRSLTERIFSLCTISIISTDRTNPMLNLSYIKNFSNREPSFRNAIDVSTATGKGRELDIV